MQKRRKWKKYLIWCTIAAAIIVAWLFIFPQRDFLNIPNVLSRSFLLAAFVIAYYYIMSTDSLWLIIGWELFTYRMLLGLLEEFVRTPSIVSGYLYPFLSIVGIVFVIWGLSLFLKKKAVKEKEQRFLEKKFKTLFESSNDAILIVKLNKIVDCNPKAIQLFKCDRKLLSGKALDALSPPEQPDSSGQHGILKKLYLAYQGKPQSFEWCFLRCDGSTFDAEISMNEFSVDKEAFIQITVKDVSERKNVKKKLLEERHKYKALFDNKNDAVIIKDIRTEKLEFNAKAAEMLGYNLDDAQNLEIDKIIPHDELEDAQKKLELLMEKGHLPIYERTLIKRDGSKIPVEINLSLVKDNEGEPIYIQSVIRDISQRKKALELIKAERDKAKKYFDIARVIMVIIDTRGYVLDINRKGCSVLECAREEIIGKNWFDNFIPERIRDHVREIFSSIISGDLEPYECFENPILTRKGKEKLISWHNTYLKDDEGKITGVLSSGEDITARRKFEEKLFENEEKFRALVSSMEDFVFTLDRDFKVTGLYGRWIDEFGIKPSEYIGKTALELFGKSGISHIEISKRVLKSETKKYEWSMVQNGKQLHFQTKLHPLCNSSGDIIGVVGITRDITRLKKDRDLLEKWVNFHNHLLEILAKILQGDFIENPFDDLLQRCIRAIPGAQAGSILLKENGIYTYVATVGYDLEKLKHLRFKPNELIRPETDEVIVIKDIKQAYNLDKELLNVLQKGVKLDKIKATLSIPVIVNKEIKALFNLDTFESPEIFDSTIVEMAEIMSKTLGFLLERLESEKRLKEQQKKLAFISTHDALTGLPNRRFLFEHASQQLALAKRYNNPLSVLYMDLNGFKKVNDIFGHEIGDILLKQVADRIKASLRESDVVARVGGDEFVFLLPDTDTAGAIETVKKLLMNLEKPFEISNKTLKISASFGISIFPTNGNDLKELLRRGDEAMYLAKKNHEPFYISVKK